jgi:hypothetical protein
MKINININININIKIPYLYLVICLISTSCATPTGKVIGENFCECLQKTSGDGSEIKKCVEQFQNEMKTEFEQQNVMTGKKNEDSAIAITYMKKCMKQMLFKIDSLRPSRDMIPPLQK